MRKRKVNNKIADLILLHLLIQALLLIMTIQSHHRSIRYKNHNFMNKKLDKSKNNWAIIIMTVI